MFNDFLFDFMYNTVKEIKNLFNVISCFLIFEVVVFQNSPAFEKVFGKHLQ